MTPDLHPTMIEILNSERHRCEVNLSAAKLQLKVAEEQLERIRERITTAQERLSVVQNYCNDLGI